MRGAEESCVGCDELATCPRDERRKRYCAKCWEIRCEQLEAEEQRFYLWRIARTAYSECWGIAHPDSTEKEKGKKVGEAWGIFDTKDQLWMNLVLLPHLDWSERVSVVFPKGIRVEETLREILMERVLDLFLEGFAAKGWVLNVVMASGEIESYPGPTERQR